MDNQHIQRLVESWGVMGSLWGVNTSVARVHGLLIASRRPWCLDEVATALRVSRSNVSTSLKELRAWGVVRRIIRPGERREFYTCEPDVWSMLFRILRERKKREFDPAYAAVQEALTAAREAPEGMAVDRLEQMAEMMSQMNDMAERVLSDEEGAREMLAFFMGMAAG